MNRGRKERKVKHMVFLNGVHPSNWATSMSKVPSLGFKKVVLICCEMYAIWKSAPKNLVYDTPFKAPLEVTYPKFSLMKDDTPG